MNERLTIAAANEVISAACDGPVRQHHGSALVRGHTSIDPARAIDRVDFSRQSHRRLAEDRCPARAHDQVVDAVAIQINPRTRWQRAQQPDFLRAFQHHVRLGKRQPRSACRQRIENGDAAARVAQELSTGTDQSRQGSSERQILPPVLVEISRRHRRKRHDGQPARQLTGKLPGNGDIRITGSEASQAGTR